MKIAPNCPHVKTKTVRHRHEGAVLHVYTYHSSSSALAVSSAAFHSPVSCKMPQHHNQVQLGCLVPGTWHTYIYVLSYVYQVYVMRVVLELIYPSDTLSEQVHCFPLPRTRRRPSGGPSSALELYVRKLDESRSRERN